MPRGPFKLALALVLTIALAVGAPALSQDDDGNSECRWSKAMRKESWVRCPGEPYLPNNDDEINWCGKVLSIGECAKETVRVDKILSEYDAEERRARRMLHNRGWSLVGCSSFCSRRLLDSDNDPYNPTLSCTYSPSAVTQFRLSNPASVGTVFIKRITNKCSPIKEKL